MSQMDGDCIMVYVGNVAYATGHNTMDTTTHIARTKLDARATSRTETNVTIDWSTISTDDLRKLAAKTVVIAWQAEARAAGEVPSEVTLNAHDYANPARKPRGPVDVKALLAKMAPEDRAALIAQYTA